MNIMTTLSTQTPFEAFLNDHDEEAWSATLTILLRSIHEVDRNATQIWFAFYPLSLFRALQNSDDPDALAARLLLQGKYYLRDQIGSSHTFLYGHRFWPDVKHAVETYAQTFTPQGKGSLADQIIAVAGDAATAVRVDPSLVVGITAVAFMTVQQVGLSAFQRSAAEVLIQSKTHTELLNRFCATERRTTVRACSGS